MFRVLMFLFSALLLSNCSIQESQHMSSSEFPKLQGPYLGQNLPGVNQTTRGHL